MIIHATIYNCTKKMESHINCTADQHLSFHYMDSFYLNRKFQASHYFQGVYSKVCVGPGQRTKFLVFSCEGSFFSNLTMLISAFRFKKHTQYHKTMPNVSSTKTSYLTMQLGLSRNMSEVVNNKNTAHKDCLCNFGKVCWCQIQIFYFNI